MPDTAILVTAARLVPPVLTEGFSALWTVRIAGANGFVVEPMT